MASKEIPQHLNKPIQSGRVFETYREIPRFDPEKMWKIAEQAVTISLDIKENDNLLVLYSSGTRQLVEMVGFKASQKGASVITRGYDESVIASILSGLESQKKIEKLFNNLTIPRWSEIKWANKYLDIYSSDTPNAYDIVNSNIKSKFRKAFEEILWYRVNNKRWSIIGIPTKQEAEIDKTKYEEYVKIFLNSCDRDWKAVKKAQNILIDTLDKGKVLELFAEKRRGEWQTSLRMDIESMTFANETINYNFPGSEVFSAPNKESVEGILSLPYPVRFSSKIYPDMKLVFKKGKVVDYHSSDDIESLGQALDTDTGSRYVGEIAFGTNPLLKRPFVNPLFVEKVGGSFHIAVGSSYSFSEVDGKKVNLNNGNKSALHEDLTCMMLPAFGGGKVVLDGKIIQKDGKFLDPRLKIINPIK